LIVLILQENLVVGLEVGRNADHFCGGRHWHQKIFGSSLGQLPVDLQCPFQARCQELDDVAISLASFVILADQIFLVIVQDFTNIIMKGMLYLPLPPHESVVRPCSSDDVVGQSVDMGRNEIWLANVLITKMLQDAEGIGNRWLDFQFDGREVLEHIEIFLALGSESLFLEVDAFLGMASLEIRDQQPGITIMLHPLLL